MSSSESKPQAQDPVLENLEWVRGLCHRLVRDAAAADDLVQDVWVAAVRKERQGPAGNDAARGPNRGPDRGPNQGYGPIRSAKGWLAGIAKNIAAGERRGGARRLQREQRAPRPGTAPPTDELVMCSEQVARVARLVSEIDEPYRRAMLLRWFEGRSVPEIAVLEGITKSTVGTRLHRGRALLRARLEREGDTRFGWALALIPAAAVEEVGAGAVSLGKAKVFLWAGALLISAGVTAPLILGGGGDTREELPTPDMAALEPLAGAAGETPAGLPPDASDGRQATVAPEEATAGQAGTQPGEIDTLEVLVHDAMGQPAPGVKLSLAHLEFPESGVASLGFTDAEGRASLPWSRVEMVGAVGQLVIAQIAARQLPRVSVPEEPQGEPLCLVLPPTGRVILEAGAPGGGLLVGRHSASLQAAFAGQGRRTVLYSKTDEGVAEFEYVALGERFSGGTGSGSVEFDGPLRHDELVRLRVGPSASLASLVGRAVDEEGAPLVEKDISLSGAAGGTPNYSVETDRRGYFTLLRDAKEVSGLYRASVRATPGAVGLRTEFLLPKGPPGGRVALGDVVFTAPPVWVSGQVFGPDGSPFAGAGVSVSANWYGAESITTGDDGRFALARPSEFEDAAEGPHPFEPQLEVVSWGFDTVTRPLGPEGLLDAEVHLVARVRIELTLAGIPDWMEGPLQLFSVEAGRPLDLGRSLQRSVRSNVFQGFASRTDTAVRIFDGRYSGLPVAEIPIPVSADDSAKWTVDLAPLVRQVTLQFAAPGPRNLTLRRPSDGLEGWAQKEGPGDELVLSLPRGPVEVSWRGANGETVRTTIPPGQDRVLLE